MHVLPATLAAPADILVDLQRLRGESPAGDSATGVQQGRALSSLAFCVAIHPELKALHAELFSFGGAASAIMDDVYAVGPAAVVFDAVRRFADAIAAMTDLLLQRVKCQCYSREYDLSTCPYRERMGATVGSVTIDDESAVQPGSRHAPTSVLTKAA